MDPYNDEDCLPPVPPKHYQNESVIPSQYEFMRPSQYEPITALGASASVRYPPKTPPNEHLNRSTSPSLSGKSVLLDSETGYRPRGAPLSPLNVNTSSEYNSSQRSYQLTETYLPAAARSRAPSTEQPQHILPRYQPRARSDENQSFATNVSSVTRDESSYELNESYSPLSPRSRAATTEQTQHIPPRYQPSARTGENQSFATSVPSVTRDESGMPWDVRPPPAALLSSLQKRTLSSPRIVTHKDKGYHPQPRNVSDESMGNGGMHGRSISDGSIRSYGSNSYNPEILQQRHRSPSPNQNHHLSPDSAHRTRFSHDQDRSMGDWRRHNRSLSDGSIKSNGSISHTGETLQQIQLAPVPLFNGSGGASQQTQLAPSPLDYHHLSPPVRLVDDRELDQMNASRQSMSPMIQVTENVEYYGNSQAGQRKTPPFLGEHVSRPNSAFSSTSEAFARGRANSPQYSPGRDPRPLSSNSGRSPDNRSSWQDLLKVSYPQPAPSANLNNAHLQNAVGSNASLLSTRQTLEMYRANVKKTNDPTIQYEFAVFMVNAVQEARAQGQNLDLSRGQSPSPGRDLDGTNAEHTLDAGANSGLLKEARGVLQRLADKSYPFAQYYLADGYASGLFNNNKPDNDKAFPLFLAASKHGHAEAGYRTALCYEYGWGTKSDPQKAVQFYRQSASKNHPGAMERLGRACLSGELALGIRYREGLKWLKRAAESADFQYNSAPYELGLLHETGYGEDLFQDKSYAAQLFVQSAELGHAEANYKMGDAYEHGKLNCPRDPALSVHYYNGAAQRAHPLAMMALCAWYMVGAEPVLEKDESEAYEWAKKAAQYGLPKAEYAVGFFTETGIGCRRDPLEANMWYVRAADHGEERAKHRLAVISAAASGDMPRTRSVSPKKQMKGTGSPAPETENGERRKSKKWGIF